MSERYISDYTAGIEFSFSDRFVQDLCGVHIELEVFEFKTIGSYRVKAHVVLRKGDFKYECVCVDQHDWEKCFYPVVVNGKEMILFRKTLYGFTLLDPETLTEVYDYFPEKVLAQEESFIIVDAVNFGEYIVFDGCYWACPYSCFVYDHYTKRFLDLSSELGVFLTDDITVCGNTLTLYGEDRNFKTAKATIQFEDVVRLMEEKGTFEF